MAFRVPVGDTSALRVCLAAEDSLVREVKLLDLSLTGALVEFPEQQHPGLPIGSVTKLEVRLGRDVVELKAEVRRHYKRQYGVFFAETITAEGLDPSEALRRIVSVLERQWLQVRMPS